MPFRHSAPLAKLASVFLILPSAALLAPAAHAQVAYNGTQNTIISGILNGGQIGYGLAVDKSGNVFLSGMGQPTSYVLEYPKSNGYQYNGVFLNTDFRGAAYGSSAYSIAFDNSGYLYVPAPQNNYLGIWQPGSYLLSATAYSTFPIGVGFGLDGNMYMADNIERDIYEIALNGGNGGNNGAIITPPCYPYSVAADSAGNVYVPCGTQVLKYTYQGVGNYSQSVVTGSLSGSGYQQLGIAVDRNGIVYVCDSHNNRVLREVPKPGGGYAESQLPWSYNNPSGITLDNQGNLYVSDSFNGNVDEITFPTAQFGAQTLGATAASQSFSFNVASGTNVGKIASLTYGQPTGDFPFTTTCTTGAHSSSGNCTVTVSFSPTAPGTRNGAIAFYDQNGNSLYSLPLSGTGQAPQLAFNGPLASTSLVQPAYTSSAGMAVDNAGNLFVANQTVDVNNFPLFSGSVLEYPNTQGSYGSPVTIANFNNPVALTVQPNGDLIVLCDNPSQDFGDQSLIFEVPKTQSGFGSPVQLASSTSQAVAAAVADSQSNVYYLAYGLNAIATIYEIPFDGYLYLPPVAIASGFTSLGGLTMDASGNLYAASLKFGTNDQVSGSILEFTASSGYKTSSTVASGLSYPQFLAIEPGGSLIVGNQTPYSGPTGNIQLLPAGESGFGPPITLVSGLDLPNGLAVDLLGNLFTTTGYYSGTGADVLATRVFHRAPAPLAFPSTPEGSTSSPQAATIENFGNQPLDFSQVAFPANFPEASGESTDCSSSTQLAAGATCTLTFNFAPNVALTGTQTALSINGTATVTTNSLNGSNVVNSIALSGTETKPIPTLSFAATTSAAFGQPIALTATVAGGVGMATAAPTGQVGFFLGSVSLGTVALTSSGETATASLTLAAGKLPVGNSTLTFHYTGDSVYNGATSNPVTVVVAQNQTQTSLTLSPTSVTPGKTVTLKATVSGTGTSLYPAGTVTFNYIGDGAPQGATLNTVALNDGTASIAQALPPGQGVVSATYSGNADYTGSTSSIIGIDVTALTPTVILAAPTANVQVGASIGFKVTVASPAAGYQPTGGVTFFANSVEFGSCTLASGYCLVSTASFPIGTQSVTANYSGDSNFNSAMSFPVEVNVVPDTPKIAVSVNPSNSAPGTPINVSATVATTDGTIAATGTVLFLLDGVPYGNPVSMTASSAAIVLSSVPVGTHSLQASYSGDANYAAGVSSSTAFTVSRPTPTVSISDATSQPTVTNYPTILVAVGNGNGTVPTGTVRLLNGSSQVAQATLASGTASIPLQLAQGYYNLTATYSGDANYAPASTASALGVRVQQGSVKVDLTSSATAITVGQSVAFTVTLQGFVAAHPPTGQVLLYSGGQQLATLPIVNATAAKSVQLPVGDDLVEAIYVGDSNYAGVSSNRFFVTVNQAATTLSVSASPYPDLFGDPLTATSKVSTTATGVAPTGTVTFFYGGNQIGTGAVTAGVATLTTTALPVGTAALSAQYSGDTNFLASNSPAPNLGVGKAAPTLALTASATSVSKGTAVTLTATLPTLSIGAGTVAPTGTVGFFNGSTKLGSSPVPSSGIVTLTLSTLPVGSNSIQAHYSGDSNFNSAASTALAITVTASN